MTIIEDKGRRVSYTAAAGQTVFPFPFAILEAGDIDVYVAGSLQPSSAYTVSGIGADAGGSITLATGATAGQLVLLNGNRANEKDTDFATGVATLLAEDLNTELSNLQIQVQQIVRDLGRTLRPPLADENPAFELPAAATRADLFLSFDSNGNPEVADVLASGTVLSRSVIGAFIYEQTPIELARGITPANTSYPYGHPRRWGIIPGTDVTAAIRTILEAGGLFLHLIDEAGDGTTYYEVDDFIEVASYTVIVRDPGAEVRIPTGGTIALTPAATRFGLFRMIDCEGVHIFDRHALTRYETKPSDGEAGHIYDFRGARNCTLHQPRCEDSGGDGVYIGAGRDDTGTHDGGNNAAVLSDSTASWAVNDLVGRIVSNTTDGSEGIITANTATTVTATLAGGGDNDWDTSDAYAISGRPSEQITVYDPIADNCRRQGGSIVSGKNITIYGGVCRNIGPQSPQAGWDIEPDNQGHFIEDVTLIRPRVEANGGAAVLVALQNLARPIGSEPYVAARGAYPKQVSVEVIGARDHACDSGFRGRGGDWASAITGFVRFVDCYSERADNQAFGATNWAVGGPRLEYVNLEVERPNQAGSTSDEFGSAFQMSDDGTQVIGFQGNIHIKNPRITDADGNITNYFYARVTKTGTHDGANNAAVLSDSTAEWPVNGLVGALVTNGSDGTGSSGIITANTATTITATLAGGTDNDWDTGDGYTISQLVQDVFIDGGDVDVSGQTDPAQMVYFDGAGAISDPRRQMSRSVTASPLAVGPSSYNPLYDNDGAAITVELDLADFPPGCPDLVFEVLANGQILRVDPDAGSRIEPGSNAAGGYIQASDEGARLRLRRESRTRWYIVEEIGTWTHQ